MGTSLAEALARGMDERPLRETGELGVQANSNPISALVGSAARFFARRGPVRAIVAGMLAFHAGLLAYSASKHSPDAWEARGEWRRHPCYQVVRRISQIGFSMEVAFAQQSTHEVRTLITEPSR